MPRRPGSVVEQPDRKSSRRHARRRDNPGGSIRIRPTKRTCLTGRLCGPYRNHRRRLARWVRMVATEHVTVEQMARDLCRKLDLVPTPPPTTTRAWRTTPRSCRFCNGSATQLDGPTCSTKSRFSSLPVINTMKGAAVTGNQERRAPQPVRLGAARPWRRTRPVRPMKGGGPKNGHPVAAMGNAGQHEESINDVAELARARARQARAGTWLASNTN